jgi:phage baseplate assembly protein W
MPTTVPGVLKEKLGSGLSVPMIAVNGKYPVAKELDKVKQDIFLCLSTPVGRRLMQPDFGSMLPWMLFQGYTSTIHDEIIVQTKQALDKHLPTILVKEVLVDDQYMDEHCLVVIIRYVLRGTQAGDEIKIALSTSDQVKLPPEFFTIGGSPIFLR